MGKEWIETWTDDGGSEWESTIRVLDAGETDETVPGREQKGPGILWAVRKWDSPPTIPTEVATALGITMAEEAKVETEADPLPSAMTAGYIPLEGAMSIKKADPKALSDALAQAWENVSQTRRRNA